MDSPLIRTAIDAGAKELRSVPFNQPTDAKGNWRHMQPKQVFKLTGWQQAVAHLLANRSDASMPGTALLDRIVEGTITPAKIESLALEHFNWLDDSWEAIDWWRKLSDCALQGRNPDGVGEFGPNPAFAEHRKILAGLLGDLLSAFLLAQQETSAYSENWGSVGPGLFEFLRRYRLYTRFVEALTMEAFPNLDRELLLNPDFSIANRTIRVA